MSNYQVRVLVNPQDVAGYEERIISAQSDWTFSKAELKLNPTIQKDGFLATCFETGELARFLSLDGELYVCELDSVFCGFALVTGGSVFEQQITAGSVDWGNRLDLSEYRYLYQIVVTGEYARKGAGNRLLREVCSRESNGLIADVLMDPFCNEPSLKFFEANGFSSLGTLTLGNYRDYGKLQSKVFLWKRPGLI